MDDQEPEDLPAIAEAETGLITPNKIEKTTPQPKQQSANTLSVFKENVGLPTSSNKKSKKSPSLFMEQESEESSEKTDQKLFEEERLMPSMGDQIKASPFALKNNQQNQ